jgi:DNA-binding PadR family transcriptional regulator
VTTERIRGSSDRSVLVLTSLASGPKHGYALIKDIEDFAGVHLGAGTLYASLAKLEDDGLIAPLRAEGRRYPYEITPKGSRWLRERLSESRRIANLGLARLTAGGR